MLEHEKACLIKHMRERTGLSVIECRFFLEKSNWNLEKAIELTLKTVF